MGRDQNKGVFVNKEPVGGPPSLTPTEVEWFQKWLISYLNLPI